VYAPSPPKYARDSVIMLLPGISQIIKCKSGSDCTPKAQSGKNK